jgi:hypothetical protein
MLCERIGALRWCSVNRSVCLCNTQWADQGAQGRAGIYSVTKKQQGLSTNTERERQEVAEEIKYIGGLKAGRYRSDRGFS